MFDWLRNLLMPTPALVGVTAGRATLPAVMAFSEEGGGEQPPAEEKPAEPPATEAPAETPAPAPAPAPPTGDVPATQSVSMPSEILGRPLMNFIADMAAVAGAILLVIAWMLEIRISLAWQGALFAVGTIVLVLLATLASKRKNWSLVYGKLGGYQFVFVVLQWILAGGFMPLGFAILSLIGTLLMTIAGVLGVLVFKTDQLDKPWPHGVTIKVPGA